MPPRRPTLRENRTSLFPLECHGASPIQPQLQRTGRTSGFTTSAVLTPLWWTCSVLPQLYSLLHSGIVHQRLQGVDIKKHALRRAYMRACAVAVRTATAHEAPDCHKKIPMTLSTCCAAVCRWLPRSFKPRLPKLGKKRYSVVKETKLQKESAGQTDSQSAHLCLVLVVTRVRSCVHIDRTSAHHVSVPCSMFALAFCSPFPHSLVFPLSLIVFLCLMFFLFTFFDLASSLFFLLFVSCFLSESVCSVSIK